MIGKGNVGGESTAAGPSVVFWYFTCTLGRLKMAVSGDPYILIQHHDDAVSEGARSEGVTKDTSYLVIAAGLRESDLTVTSVTDVWASIWSTPLGAAKRKITRKVRERKAKLKRAILRSGRPEAGGLDISHGESRAEYCLKISWRGNY